MAQELLLLEPVSGLGYSGDVVKVADGYARNYLLPRGLATPLTKSASRRIEKLQEKRAEEIRNELQGARELANRLGAAECAIGVKVNEEGSVYGSVGAGDIVDALAAEGHQIDRTQLKMDGSLKELGEFEIPVKLHAEVETTLRVRVVAE